MTRNKAHIVVLIAMLLSVFVMAAPDAHAATVTRICEEGERVGDQCIVEGAAPVAGPAQCPVGAEVFQDDGECFTRVEAEFECPADTTPNLPDGTDCRQPVELQPGPLTCQEGFGLIDGQCVRYEDAQFGCLEGDLVGGEVCVVQGQAPVNGPATCPVSATVVQEDGECFTRVAPSLSCDEGTEIDIEAEACRQPVALVPGAPMCPQEGFGLIDGQCVRYEDPVCAEGDLLGALCIIVGAPPVRGPAVCPVSATVIQDGNECYTLVAAAPDGSCPADTTPDPGGACRRPVALRPGALMCEAGFGLVDGQCIRYEAPLCEAGELVGDVCVVVGTAPVSGPATCPVSPTVFQDNGECYSLTPLTRTCPEITTPDPDGESCRRPVALVPGAPMCPQDGFGIVNGQCVRYDDPALTCDEGELVGGELCLIIGAPPVRGPAVCPVSATVFQDGDECFTLVEATEVCPADTTVDPDGLGCRRPVDLIPGAPQCPDEGFAVVDGRCITTVPVIYLCNDLVVTINMRTGANGIGTSGPDVILGTNEADVISAFGGADVICAGGGDDLVRGGAGDDVIFGQGGDDDLRGGTENDDIRGGGGSDLVYGGSGNDALRGGRDNDVIYGQMGDDDMRGGAGDDEIRDGSGNNMLRGSSGNDTCYASATAFTRCETVITV